MLKYLRIAITALSLTACVLFVALWVRSYRSGDRIYPKGSDFNVGFVSNHGRIVIHRFANPSFLPFDYPPGPGEWEFIVSHRLLVTVTGIIAAVGAVVAVPWLPWPHRFSLRTLLIATTLVAVALGIVNASR
jgi:hypothetical protein